MTGRIAIEPWWRGVSKSPSQTGEGRSCVSRDGWGGAALPPRKPGFLSV